MAPIIRNEYCNILVTPREGMKEIKMLKENSVISKQLQEPGLGKPSNKRVLKIQQ